MQVGPALGVGDDVVAVAAVLVGRSRRAGRVHHGNTQVYVAQGDGFGDPVGDLVGLDVDVVGQVDHRLHDHLGVAVAAPGPGSARR